MQSGVLSQDSLNDMLRSISQRRRQGVLEITLDARTIKILFVQGRVVEVEPSGQTIVQETVERLMRAGFPCEDPSLYEEKTYGELLKRLETELPEDKKVTDEILKHVIKHRILDHLYSLEVGGGAFYTFRVQMVEADKDFCPAISVGQLLLDLVELPDLLPDFQAKFPEGGVVKLTGPKPEGSNEDERALLDVIGSGAAIDELRARSMLSTFHFIQAVIELENSGIIANLVANPEDGAELVSDISKFLESSIDAAFGVDADEVTGPSDMDSDLATSKRQYAVSEDRASSEEIENVSRSIQSLTFTEHVKVFFAPRSAALLQSTLLPAVTAICFLILALVLPFVSWYQIFTAFAG